MRGEPKEGIKKRGKGIGEQKREAEGGKRDLRVFRGDGERVAWEEKGLGNRDGVISAHLPSFTF